MRSKKEKGQILIFVSLSLLLLVGMLGLVVDGGWAYFRQQSAQSAADAAAMAGAQAALYNSGGYFVCGTGGVVCQTPTSCSSSITTPPANDIDSACLYAQTNGFSVAVGGKQNVTIEANITNPPPTAPGVNDNYYVTARVSESFPLTFASMLGRLSQFLAARATAVISERTQTCVYTLNPGGTSLSISGSTNINVSCGFFVNSNMTVSGSGTLTTSEIEVAGTYSPSGSIHVTPTPTTGVPRIGDPLAYLSALRPTVGSCNFTNVSVSGSGTKPALNPGVYCGGIRISGSVSQIFNPGTYILNGGGLTISGSSTITGTGVTFYNTATSGHTYGGINISGSSTENFSAPTNGALQGILFFQDPTIPVGSASNSISGSGSSSFKGVLYFPTTNLDYSGSATSTGYTSLVAYNLTLSGSGSLNSDFVTLPNGSPFKAVALVE